MIYDNISNYSNYLELGENFKKAFEFLTGTDLQALENGKHTIEGDEIFAVCMEYDTKPLEAAKNEGHRKYIDVQYVVSGYEEMRAAPVNGLCVTEEYDEDNDVVFYEKQTECKMTAEPGSFAIFWPEDSHMPGIAAGGKSCRVKKIVVKVHV